MPLVAMATKLKIRKKFLSQFRTFFAAISGKRLKFLNYAYSSIIQHFKTVVAKEICGLQKIIHTEIPN